MIEEIISHTTELHIRQQISRNNARKFLKLKYSWNENTIQNIDRMALQNLLNNSTFYKWVQTLKFVYHRLPTGKRLFQELKKCPYYNYLYP